MKPAKSDTYRSPWWQSVIDWSWYMQLLYTKELHCVQVQKMCSQLGAKGGVFKKKNCSMCITHTVATLWNGWLKLRAGASASRTLLVVGCLWGTCHVKSSELYALWIGPFDVCLFWHVGKWIWQSREKAVNLGSRVSKWWLLDESIVMNISDVQFFITKCSEFYGF